MKKIKESNATVDSLFHKKNQTNNKTIKAKTET